MFFRILCADLNFVFSFSLSERKTIGQRDESKTFVKPKPELQATSFKGLQDLRQVLRRRGRGWENAYGVEGSMVGGKKGGGGGERISGRRGRWKRKNGDGKEGGGKEGEGKEGEGKEGGGQRWNNYRNLGT